MKFRRMISLTICVSFVGSLLFVGKPAPAQPGTGRFEQSTPALPGPPTLPFITWKSRQPANPEVDKLNKEDQKLESESRKLVREYDAAKDDGARNTIREKLTETVARHFDARQKRRELELQAVEERVKRLRETFDKRNEARQTIIDKRLDQLISEVEGLAF